MAGYVGLFKFTQQGLESLKEMPQAFQKAREAAQQMGIRIIGIWVTMGEYDVLGIADVPDDKVAAQFALHLGRTGLVTTMTMRALSEAEFAEVVGKMD